MSTRHEQVPCTLSKEEGLYPVYSLLPHVRACPSVSYCSPSSALKLHQQVLKGSTSGTLTLVLGHTLPQYPGM